MTAELRADVRRAFRSDPSKARALLSRYERAVRAEGTDHGIADAALLRGEWELIRGRPRAAANAFAASRDSFRRADEPLNVFAADVSAIQAHALLGDRDAVRRLTRSLRRASVEPWRLAYAECAIGDALDAFGESAAAEESFRRALGLVARKRRPPQVAILRATASQNLALQLARRGAASEARRHFDRALTEYEALDMAAPAAIVRWNRGWASGLAGEIARGLGDLASARAAFEAIGDRRRAALCHVDDAELRLRVGDVTRATDSARSGVTILRRLDSPQERARALLTLARTRIAAGAAASGRKSARTARELFAHAGDRTGEAGAAVFLGEDLGRAEATLRRQGRHLASLEALLARAAALPPARARRLLQDRLPRVPPVFRRWLAPRIWRLRAETEPDRRIPHLRKAVAAAEDLRRRAPTSGLRAATLVSESGAYEALARALLDRGRSADRKEAFRVLDSLRARTLNEELEREAPGLTSDPRVRALRRSVEELWHALERREQKDDSLRGAATVLWREVAKRERELVLALEETEPRAAPRDPERSLPRSDCLCFSVLQDEVLGLLASGGEVAVWSCGSRSKIQRELDAFRFQTARRLHGAVDPAPALAGLDRLHALLLADGPDLSALSALRVVLPPELGSLPVEALPAGAGGDPLAARCVVRYAPRAAGQPRRSGGRRVPLLVGLEDASLPEVRRELRTIRRRLEAAERLGGVRATRDEILARIPGRRLVHFAGHARTHEQAPLLSALRVRDGWLAAEDLRGVDLRGALVVLSACRSSDPGLRWHGEALGGFPRALLAAGASGLIGTRWEVADAVAHAWMRILYRHLTRLPPEEALSQAASEMRRRMPHPADWAAFLFVGT